MAMADVATAVAGNHAGIGKGHFGLCRLSLRGLTASFFANERLVFDTGCGAAYRLCEWR